MINTIVTYFLVALLATAAPRQNYSFTTVNNPADPTFNQLLGINNENVIVGYFGSGATGHSNKGYVIQNLNLQQNPHNFLNLNFPGSAQTQDICINNRGKIGGFWADDAGNNFGFIFDIMTGIFVNVNNPKSGASKFNQILGVNDKNIAVGFFTDSLGINHAFKYDINRNEFTDIIPPSSLNCVSTTATGINNAGSTVGFCTTSSGITISFFASRGTSFRRIVVDGSKNTQALGVNNKNAVVGSFEDNNGKNHGFITQDGSKGSGSSFKVLDAPNANGMTVINGLNDAGKIVGFFLDYGGLTNGLFGLPR